MATITKIEIDGFKAFPNNFSIDLSDGKNLLIYGENGSGKSSLYYALHVLMQSVFKDDKGTKYFKPGDTNGDKFIPNNEQLININRFDEAKANTYTPNIRITFDDGKVWRLDNGGLQSENGGNESDIRMLNKDSAFINHSYISRFHAARNSEEINLWNVFYKDILPFLLPAGTSEFLADLYDNIKREYNGGVDTKNKVFQDQITKFNDLLNKYIDRINIRINSIYNDNFKNEGDKDLNIKLIYYSKDHPDNALKEQYYLFCGKNTNGANMFYPPKIGIEIKEAGVLIYKPQSYFNEAKLTAIALAVRFAAMSTTAITPGSFLALDDMLISLDMSNRAKVMEYLLKLSDKYKIYLFTHDKMFFEYFKHKTQKHQSEWVCKEIYMDDNKIPYIRNSEDYLGQAEHFIKQHEYEIAGNFLRKAAELLCKNFLPTKWQLSTDYSRLDLNGLIQNCKKYAEESGLKDVAIFEELDGFRKFILNPASHDSYDIIKYRYEVEECLHTLHAFQSIVIIPTIETGASINKLDKGCLIFNTNKESGYIVAVVDNTNKGADAKYWTDDFLHVRPRKDSFNQTQNMLSLCKSFVSKLPNENGKVEKATYMNRSVEALKEESVNINTFAEQVFETPKLVSEFKQYKETYQRERDIEIDDTFETESAAIKRRATGSMTTIKLDKNFDINIHGGEQYIVRGYDEEKKMYYYQLFFKEEK